MKASEASKGLLGQSFADDVKEYFDTHLNATVAQVAAHFGLSVKDVKEILMGGN